MKMNLQHFAAEPQKGVVGRWQHPGYINVAASGTGTATYELLGFGVTQLDDSPGALNIFQAQPSKPEIGNADCQLL